MDFKKIIETYNQIEKMTNVPPSRPQPFLFNILQIKQAKLK